ncbi:MAG: DEAD/DEAH box helicase [Maricaulaceae bacterium]
MTSSNDINEIPADDPVDVTFAELGLDPKIIKALDDMGYEKPTPIQARAIPYALTGQDVLGIAQTGTGKTGAFTLPTVHKLATGRARARMPRCLIVCPTRELAAQVAENVELYGKYLKLEMALLIGGVSFAEQDRKLSRGVDVLIATPGRLLDQFDRGKILLTGVQTLVVDEADRMLDMGFIPDIEKIFKLTPFTRQVLFFSATMPNEIKRLVEQFLHQPKTVQIARKNITAKTVTQRIVRVPKSDAKLKRTALRWVIDNADVQNGIVFCNRKKDVDIVAKSLTKHGHSAEPIHGDLAQSLRTETLEKFKTNKIKLLVASDVAARGLDVPSVSHVFNYDVPNHAEDYVHRIGRTGRAGRKGDTVMFVSRLDEKNYQAILHMLKSDGIEELEVPGIEDFPTERDSKYGKNKRGSGRSSGRNDKGGRGGDRGRNRPRRNESENRNERSKATSQVTQTDEQAPKDKARRKAPSRRKAPGRDGGDAKIETPDTPAEKPTPKKIESRRPAPGKKKAPEGKKAPEKTQAPTPKQTQEPKQASEKKKASEKKRERKADKPRESENRREKPKHNETKKSSGRSKKPRGNGGRDRDTGEKSDFEGFGDSVPAFFKL